MGLEDYKSEIPLPLGLLIKDGRVYFGKKYACTRRKCIELSVPYFFDELKEFTLNYLVSSSDEIVFRYLKGNYEEILFSSELLDKNIEYGLKLRALRFIFSKNPELQEKYPNFEGIAMISKEKLKNTTEGRLWFDILNKARNLSIHTRPVGENSGTFEEEYYSISDDGELEFILKKTTGDIEAGLITNEVISRAMKTLGDS